MRKIINDPNDFVDEVVEGILAAHPRMLKAVSSDRRALARADAPIAGHVGIVTGGGSGHLPLFLGYVGQGLCTAVAVGNMFSSPSSEQILAATRAAHGGAGVLYLYGNYGGDVMNFDLAGELALDEGIETATVLGTDDVASAPPSRHATAAVEKRGKSAIGDKTVLDALIPSVRALEATTSDEGVAAMIAAARSIDETTPSVARRGRAAWLGERAQGHPDPGAVAYLRFLEALQRSIDGSR